MGGRHAGRQGKPQGTGLGLALAARVASAHGGELRLAESTAGARFEVLIPEGGHVQERS